MFTDTAMLEALATAVGAGVLLGIAVVVISYIGR